MADILEATIAPAEKLSPTGAEVAGNVAQFSRTGEMLKARLPNLVKGAGYAGTGNAPLTDEIQIMTKASQAAIDLRQATWDGITDKPAVVKGMNQGFLNQFGYLKTALTAPSLMDTLAGVFGQMPGGSEAFKNFTAGNLGIGSVYGLVPFDLMRPSRLIYPVYTVFRNKFPRPQGQGTSAQERVITGISGSQTGGQGVLDVSITELVQSGGTFSNWPLNLPPSGSQTEVFLN